MLEWFDNYKAGAKALNRQGSRRKWKCLIEKEGVVTHEYGDTPEEAVEKCLALAKQRVRVLRQLREEDRLAEAVEEIIPNKPLEEWER